MEFFCKSTFFCTFAEALAEELIFRYLQIVLRGGAEVARQAHNLKVRGSNPLPATFQGSFFITDAVGLTGFLNGFVLRSSFLCFWFSY